MRNTVLPVMTVLTIVAGAVGMQLGEGAISQIDPIYFQRQLPPRDVSKDPRPASSSAFAEASGWAEGYQARAADCGPGCAPVAPAATTPVAPLRTYRDATIEPRWHYADYQESGDEVRVERSMQSAQVQRYLHYPVSAEQADIRAAVEAEPVEVVEAAEPAGL